MNKYLLFTFRKMIASLLVGLAFLPLLANSGVAAECELIVRPEMEPAPRPLATISDRSRRQLIYIYYMRIPGRIRDSLGERVFDQPFEFYVEIEPFPAGPWGDRSAAHDAKIHRLDAALQQWGPANSLHFISQTNRDGTAAGQWAVTASFREMVKFLNAVHSGVLPSELEEAQLGVYQNAIWRLIRSQLR